MEVPATPANRALASAIRTRMNADARQINATAAFWRALGIGAALALTGIGVGAAFLGYSYVSDGTASADRIADAIARALRDTTFKATGEIALDTAGASVRMADGKVALVDGASVRVDPGSTVKLDPAAKVAFDPRGAEEPRPAQAQLQPPKARTGPDIATNFTVFKSVAFAEGDVVTGWEFTASDQPAPSFEYCYYKTRAIIGGARLVVDVANNGQLTKTEAPAALAGFDVGAAGQKCVWFDGAVTRPAP